MAKIGDYVHYRWTSFEERGINKIKGASMGGEAAAEDVFKSQIAMAKKGLGTARLKRTLEGIEKQLNYWFQLMKGKNPELKRNYSTQEIQEMKAALEQHYAAILKNAIIDDKTLSAAVSTGQYNIKIFDEIQNCKEILNNLQNYASKKSLSTKQFTSYEAVEKRMTELLALRDKISEDLTNIDDSTLNLFLGLNQLQAEWTKLTQDIGQSKQISFATHPEARSLVQDLNEIIKLFLRGKSQVVGTYTEGVVAAINKFVTADTIIHTNDILQALNQNIKSANKSQSALLESNISSNIDIEKVVEKTTYAKESSKTPFGRITTSKTEGKVDVIYEFNDLKIPASVKNYNFANTGKFADDIHILQGSSILQLIQEYQDFSNYYMNIAAVHPDGDPTASVLSQAHLAMKMTILLHALQGSTQRMLASGGVNPDTPAEIFIINDSSKGRFRVFSMRDILRRVSADVESYLKITNFESIETLTNDWEGEEDTFSWSQAYVRITHLLQQLHNIQFDVSISKSIFQI